MTSGGQPRDWEASFSERWLRLSRPRTCWPGISVDRAESMMAVANEGCGRPRKSGKIEDLVVRDGERRPRRGCVGALQPPSLAGCGKTRFDADAVPRNAL